MEQCTYCDATFIDKYKLKRHQQTSTKCVAPQNDQSGYTCEVCRKTYNRKDNLIQHQKKCFNETKISINKLADILSDKLADVVADKLINNNME